MASKNSPTIPLGAHIYSPRLGGLYNHHGIYVGNGKVVHYSGFSKGLCSGPVKEVSFGEFSNNNNEIFIRFYKGSKFSPSEIVKRAKSRLGEDKYNLFRKNCEHFATWVHTAKEGGFEFLKLADKVIDVLIAFAPVPPPVKIAIITVKGIYDHVRKRFFNVDEDKELGELKKVKEKGILFVWSVLKESIKVWQSKSVAENVKTLLNSGVKKLSAPIDSLIPIIKKSSGSLMKTATNIVRQVIKI